NTIEHRNSGQGVLIGSVAVVILMLDKAVEPLPLRHELAKDTGKMHCPKGIAHLPTRLQAGAKCAIGSGVVNEFVIDQMEVFGDQPSQLEVEAGTVLLTEPEEADEADRILPENIGGKGRDIAAIDDKAVHRDALVEAPRFDDRREA